MLERVKNKQKVYAPHKNHHHKTVDLPANKQIKYIRKTKQNAWNSINYSTKHIQPEGDEKPESSSRNIRILSKIRSSSLGRNKKSKAVEDVQHS